MLYQSPFISPVIFLINKDNETVIRKCNKSNVNETGSNFSIHNENNMKSSCTDKIPLLCSVTSVNRFGDTDTYSGGIGAGGTDDNYADGIDTKDVCNTSKSIVDDYYNKPSISGINKNNSADGIESINLECISTISN